MVPPTIKPIMEWWSEDGVCDDVAIEDTAGGAADNHETVSGTQNVT